MTPQFYLFAVAITFTFSVIIALFVINPVVKSQYIKKANPDISVNEMAILERKLSDFLQENNLKPGVSIWTVANVLNVKDEGSVDNIKARARMYEPDRNGRIKVVHNKKIPDSEWLFDLAHELGHQINGDPMPADRPIGYNKPKVDQLADYTGAALLMPLEQVYNFLIANHYLDISKTKRIAVIRQLSKKYNVSEMLTVRRVNEIIMLKKMR